MITINKLREIIPTINPNTIKQIKVFFDGDKYKITIGTRMHEVSIINIDPYYQKVNIKIVEKLLHEASKYVGVIRNEYKK